jgi:hypothetical protein
LVVDFDYQERALVRKELLPTEQDFVLSALHVDFHQLWRWVTRGNKVVERDCRHVY